MKSFFISLLSLCAITLHAQAKFKLEIELKYTEPDCKDGHNQANAATPKVEKGLPNTKFYIYEGKKCIDSLKTNESGVAIVKLAAGTYDLYEAWKHFKKTPDGSPMTDFFKDCLVKEWAIPNYRLHIAEDNFTMDYNGVSASRCSNEYACLKVRHLPGQIKRKGQK